MAILEVTVPAAAVARTRIVVGRALGLARDATQPEAEAWLAGKLRDYVLANEVDTTLRDAGATSAAAVSAIRQAVIADFGS